MSVFFSAEQLAEKVGRTVRTIRHHKKNGWLKAEPKQPGVRGDRFALRTAQKWAAIHYPNKSLS